jgi:hypothetical protein
LQVIGGLGDNVKPGTYKTQSDSGGLFQFTGIKGWQLGVTVKKEGYLMGERGEGYQGPHGQRTTSYDRAIFTMWKLRGPQPLVGYSIDYKIAFDGTRTTFDIAAQKPSSDGDLRITLSRSPLAVPRSGESFNWAVKIEMLHGGGLVVENDPTHPIGNEKSVGLTT